MITTRRSLLVGILGAAVAWCSTERWRQPLDTDAPAAPTQARPRLVLLEHASAFYGPHLARTGRLGLGMRCTLERRAGRLFVIAAGRPIGCIPNRRVAAYSMARALYVHHVWCSSDGRLRIRCSIR
jgi:hypothetical protein